MSRWGLPKTGTLVKAGIWFTPSDIDRVAAFRGMTVEQFKKKYDCENGMVDVTNSPCPFLTRDNLCAIQEVKPAFCRNWPTGATQKQLDDCRGYNGSRTGQI